MLLDSYEAWPSRCIKTNRYLGSIWKFFVLFIQFGCQKNCRIPKYSSMMMAKLSTKKISFEISIMRKILKTIPWNVMKWIYQLISQENRNARILYSKNLYLFFFVVKNIPGHTYYKTGKWNKIWSDCDIVLITATGLFNLIRL